MRFAIPLLSLLAAFACAVAHGDTMVGRDSSADIRFQVLDLVNEARARPRRCGRERYTAAPPVAMSNTLTRAARDHAVDMADRNYFDHTALDGSQPRDRIKRHGYRSRLTGENIAYGPESAEEVVAGWLDSPGHCANIMDPRFREMGIAFAVASRQERIYWVQLFAWPATSD
jgi:uncharacterized protein YkwD